MSASMNVITKKTAQATKDFIATPPPLELGGPLPFLIFFYWSFNDQKKKIGKKMFAFEK